ncbi:glutamic acid-rich protein-like isoform X1 [Cucurbita maxima]|uniref:Glutamic acid-rich protein-like isoform X1 n=1 Tax=Cucurbita maxima TaxID=3661 RepID=A0A6J1JTY1_CUCMA|nr:glutamic acid-rich protein-like isoform X1 [Cucurbita maxima]
MAEELQDTDAPNEEAMDVDVGIETKIQNAMLSRVSHFKEQADSLTFEGVRRLLENDLCMETYALDVHKRYIKQCLVKCLEGVEEDNASKSSEETGGKSVSRGEAAESLEGHQSKKGAKEPCLEDEEKMEDSPVMGLLAGHKTKNAESDKVKGIKDKDDKDIPTESTIKKAIRKRTPYLKANSEKVTMAGVRRLLEDDLKLTKYALDGCKKFISQQVEEILNSCEAAEQVSNEKKGSRLKTPKKVSKESSHSTEGGSSSEEESDEVKPVKKNVTKGIISNSNEMKKRKRSTKEIVSAKKQRKHVLHTLEEDSDEDGGENVSEDGHSESSNEKPVKKEVSTPVYGKRVEHLKSVIKSCGMSVPPSIYKKVKQAPESKRESQLIKELEGILSREGLSVNPTEKEIKDVKKKKERAKELEGIDLSNIVSSSRRRSTSSYAAPPPKPKIPVKTEGDDVDDTDDEEEEEDDDDDDDGEEEDDEEDNGDVDESQGEEEFNEDDNEDSD